MSRAVWILAFTVGCAKPITDHRVEGTWKRTAVTESTMDDLGRAIDCAKTRTTLTFDGEGRYTLREATQSLSDEPGCTGEDIEVTSKGDWLVFQIEATDQRWIELIQTQMTTETADATVDDPAVIESVHLVDSWREDGSRWLYLGSWGRFAEVDE